MDKSSSHVLMADEALLAKIHELSDLQLAALICLIAQEHCIIDTDPEVLDDLVQELELIASKVFGLSHAVLDCSEQTSLEDFANGVLTFDTSPSRSDSPTITRQDYFVHSPTFRSISRSSTTENFGDNQKIANVIIAKNLDEAPQRVQLQALELMRTKRIFTRTSVQSVPTPFLFIALLAGGEGPRLTRHLNDYMFISHFHDLEDGFPNIEDTYNDSDSLSSVVKKSPTLEPEVIRARIPSTDIDYLSRRSQTVTVSIEVKRYEQNIISFLRLHRNVASGISAVGTKHFDKLVKCLAPLHGLAFATPSLVALAARKIYPHRIRIVEPKRERSMQYGSDLEAVKELLKGVAAEDVIEDVLGSSTGAGAPL